MNDVINILEQLIDTQGDMSVREAITWLQVEENAQSLRAEGHENDDRIDEGN